MGRLTGQGLQAGSSVQSPGQDVRCGRPAFPKGGVVTGIQCDICSKWPDCAFEGVRMDICELHYQSDRLSWVCQARTKLIKCHPGDHPVMPTENVAKNR